MSLSSKTVHGIFWVSFSNVLMKIVNFIISIILARILEPAEFGLFSLGLIVMYFFELFRDFGINSALIYKKKDVDKALNSAFLLFPFLASVFFLISYITAPIIADFFREKQLIAIIRVLSMTSIIWSFGSLPVSLLDKNLEFKKQAYRQIIPKISYGIVTILLALWGYGAWSLVIGTLVFWLLSVMVVWNLVEWRPSYKFDKKIAIELLSYGKNVASANIIVYLISIVDVSLIGRILDTSYVGYYSIALGVSGLITTQISGTIGKVMFPVYSLIQNDISHLKRAFLKTIKYTSIISIPASIGIFAISQDFVQVVYGSKWLPAVAALQVLCFYNMNRSFLGTTESLYLAAGKPEVRTKLNLLQFILMAALIYPLTIRYGIMGTAVGAMLPSVLVLVFTLQEAGKIMGESFTFIARNFIPGILGSLIMALSIWTWQNFSSDLSPVIRLAVSIIIGVSVYVGYFWWRNKEIFYEIKGLVTSI